MRKILAIATALLVTTPAMADGWGHRHGGWGGPHYGGGHHYHGGGGGDAGAAIFGGLVGGLIIGGMINSMNQPRPYYGGQVYYNDGPYCEERVVARVWNGWRWVYQTATVCE